MEFNIYAGYAFEVIIQFGAILPLFIIYRKELISPLFKLKEIENRKFYFKFFIAVLPIIIIGGVFASEIKAKIFNLYVIAYSLIGGGIIMFFLDKIINTERKVKEIKDVSLKQSFIIGLFQLLALVPGVSRSASTIIGGILLGLNRNTAAKFSFFLAIPTLLAASIYDLYKNINDIFFNGFSYLILGFVITFCFSYIIIKNFHIIISNIGFKVLGIYRIIIGLVILMINGFY